MHTKVSVIVPIYNVEKYLRKCLDSLVNQTMRELEVILVNDGSIDKSLSIAEDYCKKYNNEEALSIDIEADKTCYFPG